MRAILPLACLGLIMVGATDARRAVADGAAPTWTVPLGPERVVQTGVITLGAEPIQVSVTKATASDTFNNPFTVQNERVLTVFRGRAVRCAAFVNETERPIVWQVSQWARWQLGGVSSEAFWWGEQGAGRAGLYLVHAWHSIEASSPSRATLHVDVYLIDLDSPTVGDIDILEAYPFVREATTRQPVFATLVTEAGSKRPLTAVSADVTSKGLTVRVTYTRSAADEHVLDLGSKEWKQVVMTPGAAIEPLDAAAGGRGGSEQ